MDENDSLNVLQLQHIPHALVDIHDAIALLAAFLPLEQGQTKSDDQIRPPPESEIGAQGQQAALTRGAAEPPIGKILRVECEEYGVRQEMTGRQAHGLRRRRVGDIRRRHQADGPSIHRDILRSAEKHQRKPPVGKIPDARATVRPSLLHHVPDVATQVDHR